MRVLIIGIDCDPFSPRPDVYMKHIWTEILDNTMDNFPVTRSKCFGAWEWAIEHPGSAVLNKIWSYLKDCNENNLIRGAMYHEDGILTAEIIDVTSQDPKAPPKDRRDGSYYELRLPDGKIINSHWSSNDHYAVNDLTVQFSSNFNNLIESGVDRVTFNNKIVYEWWMKDQLLETDVLFRGITRYNLCKNCLNNEPV